MRERPQARAFAGARDAWRRLWRREEDYLRGVHYFGRAHAVNFWDAADLSEAPAHLAQIRADGFNAVVVVVPWRGFQRSFAPPVYDEVSFDRLRRLLGMVQAARLGIVLRVSYPFNHDPESEGDYDERALGLFTRPAVRAAWLDYLAKLRGVAEGFRAFRFAFFSWEDVPSIREIMPHRTPAKRRELAASLGYQRFLSDRFGLEQVSRIFGQPFEDWSQVYVPLADSEAYATFHEFVNLSLAQLLRSGREAWPGLAMQVRVDHDRGRAGGKDVWLENDVRVEDPGMRVTYYSPCMYAPPGRATISPPEALANLERMLRRVSGAGRNRNHFLDQFIFHEESPLYRHWPRIEESRMGEFLTGAATLLRAYSRGHALWNYFDYRVNHFYNPAFVRGLHGWSTTGGVSLHAGGDKGMATLAPGAGIGQRMDPHMRGHAPWLYERMEFSAMARSLGDRAGRLTVTADGVAEAEADVPGAELGAVAATLPPERHRGAEVEVIVRNTGAVPVAVTELCLWGFVYRSRIYDENGNPGPYLEPVRAMLRT